MILTKKIPSSLLLTGQTGCGKTTTARIIARTLNCNNLSEDLKPCGKCQSCVLGDSSPDVLEVNIGDTRSIDDIRGFVQQARSKPSVGKYRIFILDEVHMLLAAGANCLLKALEDSQPQTVWILATSNPEKLLPTILGRCTKLALSPVAPNIIEDHMYVVAEREGIKLESVKEHESIVRTIVDLSNGRMRDALSYLESVLFLLQSNTNISGKDVLARIASSGEAKLDELAAELLSAILTSDVVNIIKISRTCGAVRPLISKLRWITQYFLDDVAKIATFSPYGAKIAKSYLAEDGVKINVIHLVRLQEILSTIDERLNTSFVDESIVLQSALATFSIELKSSELKKR
jgi:DNA polymerase III subunit gamma/tau